MEESHVSGAKYLLCELMVLRPIKPPCMGSPNSLGSLAPIIDCDYECHDQCVEGIHEEPNTAGGGDLELVHQR